MKLGKTDAVPIFAADLRRKQLSTSNPKQPNTF
jgi:hypothetical protein